MLKYMCKVKKERKKLKNFLQKVLAYTEKIWYNISMKGRDRKSQKVSKMANKEKVLSKEVIAIVETMKAHRGEKMSFAQICELAGVEAKTGYLTAVKRELGDALEVGDKDLEVERIVKAKVNSYTLK